MTMEIKVGDKVRVREDAPEEFERFKGDDMNYEVVRINPSKVIIQHKLAAGVYGFTLSIPTKYLVKVEEEKKAPKFKKGDKVKVNLPRSIKHNRIGTVVFAYVSGNAVDDGPVYCDCGCLEPCTEPTEQTEAAKKPNVGSIKIPVEVDLTESFWDAYAAELAKEVALKVANKYTDPKEAAEYAVSVAKAVVEGLKGK